jgi:hypothetical protein
MDQQGASIAAAHQGRNDDEIAPLETQKKVTDRLPSAHFLQQAARKLTLSSPG